MFSIPGLTLIVTFLHELGHAVATLVTGGHVLALQVNFDGSGLTTSSGGILPIVICGGYLGSIFFGNLMFYAGIKYKYLSRYLAGALAIGMIIASFIWFSTLTSLLFTLGMGIVLMILFFKIPWSGRVFMIITGAYSIFYIIHDYRIGPSSDLQAFSNIAGLNPTLWMYIWLVIALVITLLFTGRLLVPPGSGEIREDRRK
jgi:hypothetical protein